MEEKENLKSLQTHLQRQNQWIQWTIQIAQNSPSVDSFCLSSLQFLHNVFSIEKSALFILEKTQLQLRCALQEKGRKWKTPNSFLSLFQDYFEKYIQEDTHHFIENYQCIPFFYEEIKNGVLSGDFLPLGLFVTQRKKDIPLDSSFLNGYLDFMGSYIHRQTQLEKDLKRANSITREISLTKITDWEQKQKIKLKFFDERLVGGKAPTMMKVLEMMDQIIPSQSSILIEGESGTGKELIAKTIHYKGPLAQKDFVSINCGALHSQILESQLFGHIKGAYTGAISDQIGLLEQASGGTLFLDEISELPLDTQAKLLRVLQEGEFSPLGSAEVKKIKFRLIVSSNRNLEKMVHKGLFRKDLFYRLNVICIPIPPLRQRKEDIPLLIDFFLQDIALQAGITKRKITERALKILCDYSWPGNIRQLKNTLEMIMLLHSGKTIRMSHVENELEIKSQKPLPFKNEKDTFLKKYIEDLLNFCGGKIPKAAQLAGTTRESFYRLMRENLKKNLK